MKASAQTSKSAADKSAASKPTADKSAEPVPGAQSGSYVPGEKEKGLFHVKLDTPSYDKTTGKKLSKAYIQKFTVPEWKHFEKNSKGLGFTTEIMWNPENKK